MSRFLVRSMVINHMGRNASCTKVTRRYRAELNNGVEIDKVEID